MPALEAQRLSRYKWFFTALLLMFFAAPAPAQWARAEEQYLKIFGLIERADSLSEKGQTNSAKATYVEAQTALLNLKKEYPNWNTKVVAFRLNYLAERVVALSPPAVAPAVESPASAPSDAKPEGGRATLPPNTQVRLLQAGAEPRQPLRFRVTAGVSQAVNLTVKSKMGMGAEAAQPMMIMPAMTMTVGVRPQSVSAEGDVHYEVVIENVDAVAEEGTMPEAVEPMKASLAVTKGLVIACTMSDRGFGKKAELRIPADTGAEKRAALEAMKDSFADSKFALPHEAIGAGARWEVRQKVKTQGMTIDQTTSYELVSVTGDVLTVKSSIAQQAANQRIPNPMMPQMPAELVRLIGAGSATMTIDLTKVMPVEFALGDQTTTVLASGAGAQRQAMTLKSETNMRLESK